MKGRKPFKPSEKLKGLAHRLELARKTYGERSRAWRHLVKVMRDRLRVTRKEVIARG